MSDLTAYADTMQDAADERADIAREEGHLPRLPHTHPRRGGSFPVIAQDGPDVGLDADGWAW